MITPNTDYRFIEFKFIEVEPTLYCENKLERKNPQTDLEEEMRMMRRNIRKVKNPVKKNRLINAYEGLVELLSLVV